jgi:hypothetical protein
MKPITKQEIQAIIDSGVTKNFIEKKLGMGQGSIGKFLTGKLNSLPDKYAAGIRKIGKAVKKEEDEEPQGIIPEVKFLDERDNLLINAARGRDECGINLDEVQIKRPKINKDLLS